MHTARSVFNELSNNYKPNKKRPELGEFCEMRLLGKENQIFFTIGWYDTFELQFNPKTVKVKYTIVEAQTKEKKSITKQISLDAEDLLDKVLDLYVKKSEIFTKK